MITADNKPNILHIILIIFYNNYPFRRSEEIYHHVKTETPTLVYDFTLYVYRIALTPDSCEGKVFPFPAKDIRKKEVTANVLLS